LGDPDQKGVIVMAEPIGPGGPQNRRPTTPLRLISGFELLEQWSEQATQVQKNIVHQVLFALTDRSVFNDYVIVDDVAKTMEFFVLARCDLTVKIRIHDFETCGLVYVGPTCAAPGLDQAAPEAKPAEPEPKAEAKPAVEAEPKAETKPDADASLPGKEKGTPHRI
jgi:hypothetical protein